MGHKAASGYIIARGMARQVAAQPLSGSIVDDAIYAREHFNRQCKNGDWVHCGEGVRRKDGDLICKMCQMNRNRALRWCYPEKETR